VKCGAIALLLLALAASGRAQVLGGAPTNQALLSTEFVAPLKYEAALEKLDSYYDEQVGRKLAVAFPEIAPRQHYEVWHDIWVAFDPKGEETLVTMKTPVDSVTGRMARGWMLNLAGRLGGSLPLTYKELPPLRTAAADIYATPRDVKSILESQTGLKTVASWQHPALLVSAAPMTNVVLSAAGLHGVHHVTVTAETEAAAKQLLARIVQGAMKPCICAAYSEAAELDAEILEQAHTKAAEMGATTGGSVFVPDSNLKHYEERIRADPAMQKRIAQAAGYYDIKYRVDRPYRQVIVTWTELRGYSRADGKFSSEIAAGRASAAVPRTPAQSAAQLTARTKMEALGAGAYRIRLEGEMTPGQPVRIDERVYWFDGKSFEEL
jgi:hypothetical protein